MQKINNRIKALRPTLLICTAILIFFSKNLNGQTGLKIGSTVSSFYYTGGNPNPYQDYDIDLRPYLGYDIELAQTGNQQPIFAPYLSLFYTFHLADRLGLRPELSFTQKGVNFTQFEYERIIYKIRISYFEIPLSLSYQFLQKEKSISGFYFGGYTAYKIRAVKNVAAHNSSIKKTKLNSVKDLEGGIHLGVNYKHNYINKVFLIDIRFFMGLNDIFKISDDWTKFYYETQKTKITGINLSIGYEF